MGYPKIELLKNGQYIHLNEPKIETKNELEKNSYVATAITQIRTKVANLKDKSICDAIIKYATEQGITDLFLIDEEFIKSALLNEMQRREKPRTNFDKITENEGALAEWLESLDICIFPSKWDCYTKKYEGCKHCIKEWLQKEVEDGKF